MNLNIIHNIVIMEYRSSLILTDDVLGYTKEYEEMDWEVISLGKSGARARLFDNQHVVIMDPEIKRQSKYDPEWEWYYDLGGLEFDVVYRDTDNLLPEEWNYCCSRVRSQNYRFNKFSAY